MKSISLFFEKLIFRFKNLSINNFRRAKLILLIFLITLGAIFSYWVYIFIFKDLPDPRGLRDYRVIPVSTKITDRKGRLLYEIYKDQNRTPVKLSTLPKYVVQATIAIEDADFYKHSGISIFGGILRSIKDAILYKKKLQGGSTITQQLVKSAFLRPERTIQRKLREIVLALWVEQLFSKNEILELYLNQVPYGGVSYGIQEASRLYFDKDASRLTLSEAALLAGLPQAPSYYSPFTNYYKALKRQREVLKRMEELGFISKKQRDIAQKERIRIKPPRKKIRAPHFVFYVKSLLEKKYGVEMIERGGLEVQTTLDSDIQASAESAIKNEINALKRLKITNGAALVTRPSTGEILAMVGSYDFFSSPSGSFNVTTARRQPGSAIKPVNYAIGLERKLVSPATVFLDVPTCFIAPGQPKPYCPHNYDFAFHGAVQLRFALGNSYNIPAVKMLALNTVEDFIASSSAFLISSFKDPKRYGLSLTLGGGEITMIEMAQAFSAFPNEGIPVKLNAILLVKDKYGRILYKFKNPNFIRDVKKRLNYPKYHLIKGKRAISKETAYLISHILLDNVARSAAFGPSSALVIPSKKAVSVKTGTTNDFRDNWTIGYTPNFLTVVWVGNNDNSRMSYVVSGVTGAAPIWNKIMRGILASQDDLWPRKPDGVVGKEFCYVPPVISSDTEQDENSGCVSRFEYYIKGTENLVGVTVSKEFVPVNKDTGAMTNIDDPLHELQEKIVVTDVFGSKYCLDCAHGKDIKEPIQKVILQER